MVRDCGAQLRIVGSAVIGLDFGAVLAFGAAVGAPPLLLAEILSDIEGVVVSKVNERTRSMGDG